jgi:glycosyltransferase involved in cell wall biosynthesis
MPNSCTLSIVSANYNNAPFLDDYFESICKSTVLPNELIFVDDASTDGSLEMAKGWEKKCPFPVIILGLTKNIGFANALNAGIKVAKGDLILRLDPDDFVHPNRIGKEKEFLEQNPTIDVAGSNTYYYNSFRRRVVGKSNFPAKHADIEHLFRKGFVGICNGSFTARRSVFETVSYEQQFVPIEEYVLFSKMILAKLTLANITEPLTYYRLHKQNRSVEALRKNSETIANQRKLLWDETLSNCNLRLRVVSGYFYWESLMAKNSFVYWIFLIPLVLLRLKRFYLRIAKG